MLRQQSGATQRFVRDTGYVFDALSERKGQLRDLIRNSNRTWEAIASRDAQLADTFRVFPTFLREGRTTTQRLTKFANDTNPLITQLRPAAREISPTLDRPGCAGAGPEGPVPGPRPAREGVQARPAGDGAGPRQHAPDTAPPRPVPAQLHADRRLPRPLQAGDLAFIVNDAAATQGTERGFNRTAFLHYLRTRQPGEPGDDDRLAVPARHEPLDPYTEPGGYDKLKTEGHLEVLGGQVCTSRPTPPPPEPNEFLTPFVAGQIEQFIFGGTENRNAAPPCDPQAPLGSIVGQSGQFPHLEPLP